jgi:hypothetical protein
MAKRVYLITRKSGAVTTSMLVRAHTPGAAIQHASRGYFTVEVASQDTLIAMLKKNPEAVLEATAEQAELPMAGNEAT